MNSQAYKSVQNGTIRLPLDHPETEQIAKRIIALVSSQSLAEDERGDLIKRQRDLRKVDYYLARRLAGRPLPATSLRPMFWDDYNQPSSAVFGHSQLDIWTGWVLRLREDIEKLERRCCARFDNGGGVTASEDDI